MREIKFRWTLVVLWFSFIIAIDSLKELSFSAFSFVVLLLLIQSFIISEILIGFLKDVTIIVLKAKSKYEEDK